MNKFNLVYQDAITTNEPNKVNIKPIEYVLGDLKVSANLYLPANFDDSKQYPGITVAHPNGGVKEQVAGLFAQHLAELGYVTLAADARYQGASAGEPRQRDWPEHRIEDIRGMVDYLSQLPYINTIGSFGICGGAGYTFAAASSDHRIKAVATLSLFNSGRVRRSGFQDSDKENIEARLKKAATARTKELTGEIEYEGDNPPMTDDQLRELMSKMPAGLYRDGVEYYGLTHAHPNSNSRYTTESLAHLMMFDADDRADLITQPLLMMAGDQADTKYMTDSAFEKAVNTKTKELFIIPGASHIQTYWVPEYVDQAVEKLNQFFKENL